ncbi:MAG: T9SS type A sorting domain-containing protein [bacterium]|nr:T9SS type A sorting domain-containing protein [bacterium]
MNKQLKNCVKRTISFAKKEITRIKLSFPRLNFKSNCNQKSTFNISDQFVFVTLMHLSSSLKERKLITFLTLFILLFSKFPLNAQMHGWPLSTHSSATITVDETWCSDRARVTGMTTGSTNRTLTLDNFEGSFSSGDWVMIIQMINDGSYTSMGSYTMCEVNSNSSTTGSGTVSGTNAGSVSVKPYVTTSGTIYTNTWPSFTLGGNLDYLQIVKVKRYWNLTINSGILTCPPFDWNKGTGGILCVMVGNNFIMNGGYFNVSGKGFPAKFLSPTGSIGVGSNGAPAATTWALGGSCLGSHTGSVDRTLYPAYNTFSESNNGLLGEPDAILKATNTLPLQTSYNGATGGPANNVVSNGSTSSPTDFIFSFLHSIYSSNYLVLGCPGTYGEHSATGGGGWGGKGGNLYGNTVSGQLGVKGEDGKKGGNAGIAGVGGGILYIKVANSTLNFANNQVRFSAAGSNGGNGGNGGDGGRGGKGGLGADGGCNSGGFVTSGGVGGYGDGGNGGNGGDAGSGGHGGTIWILKKSGGTHATFSTYSWNPMGKGGKGGAPGFKYSITKTPRPINYSPAFSLLPCNINKNFHFGGQINYCPAVVCDCDEVFRHLGSDMAGGVNYTNTSTTTFNINSTSNPGQPPIYWNGGTGLLYYTKVTGSCSTRYECKMKRSEVFLEFMDKVSGKAQLMSYNGSGSLNSGIISTNMNGINTVLYSLNGHKIYEYDPLLKRLTDFDDIINAYPYVDVDACVETNGVIGGSSGGGAGTGNGNGINEHPTEDATPIIGVPSGNRGADANITNFDGSFYENDNLPLPPLNNDGSQNGTNIDIHSLTSNIEHTFKGTFNDVDSTFTRDDFVINSDVNQLTLVNNKKYHGRVVIINSVGQQVYTGNLTEETITLTLPTGVYIINIFGNYSHYATKIFIYGN